MLINLFPVQIPVSYTHLDVYKRQVKYEPKRFVLLDKFEYLGEKIRPLTYLPDFIGNGFVVECKGFMGDSFPLRWKLFKHYLKRHRSKMKCYLVRNHKQVDEMTEEIKTNI